MFEVNVLGANTYTWHYGADNGPTVILVHGFRGDHHGLEGIAQALSVAAPTLRILVPDLPGFGASPAVAKSEHNLDLYGHWLCALAVAVEAVPEQLIVVGHSFGSMVVANALSQGLSAAQVALINPISAPALAGPKAFMTQLAILYYKLASILPERASRSLLGNAIIVRIMSEFMAKTRDHSLRAWIHDQHHRYFSKFSDSKTLLQAFRASVSHTVSEYSHNFQAPTLLIAGDRDDITPLSKQLELCHRIPTATLHIVPGVGHLVHYEAVDETVAELRTFMHTGEML